MKLQKVIKVQGKFAKTGVDIKDGDLITILDAGMTISGDYGDQDVFKIKTASGEELNKSFNRSTKNNLIDAFGEDTEKWVGQEVKAWVIRAMVSGKLQNVAYFAPADWIMNDDGSFHPEKLINEKIKDEVNSSSEIGADEIPF